MEEVEGWRGGGGGGVEEGPTPVWESKCAIGSPEDRKSWSGEGAEGRQCFHLVVVVVGLRAAALLPAPACRGRCVCRCVVLSSRLGPGQRPSRQDGL